MHVAVEIAIIRSDMHVSLEIVAIGSDYSVAILAVGSNFAHFTQES